MRVAALWLLAACTTRETVVMPEPPIDPVIESLVIVFEGETPFVYAIDLIDRSSPLLEIEATGWMDVDFTAVAFGFDRPLSFYGLSAGLLRPIEGERSCALTKPITGASYDSSEQIWRTLEPRGHASLDLVVNESMFGCTPVDFCRLLQGDIMELPSNENAQIVLPLDNETALVGLRRGRFFEVTRTGLSERTDLTNLPSDTGLLSPSGEIWLAGDGKLAHGPRSGPFVEIAVPVVEHEQLPALAVRGEEVLVLGIVEDPGVETSTIILKRLAGGSWTTIDRRVEPTAALRQSEIRWIEDDAVIVFGGLSGLVWDGARIISFTLTSPIPLFEPHLNDIAQRADYGAVIASGDGYLYKLEGGPTDWVPIREAILGNGIKGVGPAYEGFLFGGPDGKINQFYPDSTPCTTARLAGSDAEFFLQFGDAVLVSGGNPHGDEPNTVTWIYE